ncbi:MAG: hypothetical protein ACJ8LN_00795 [Sulfurifustis sp.]
MKRAYLMFPLLLAAFVLSACGSSGGDEGAGQASNGHAPEPIVALAQTMINTADANEAPWDVDRLAILSAPNDAETLDL